MAGPRLMAVEEGEEPAVDLSPFGVERRAAFTFVRRGDAVEALGDGSGATNDAADGVTTCCTLTTAAASAEKAGIVDAPVAPLSTGMVVERTRAGTLLSAVGDEQGVRLGSLGAGEAAPARLGLLPLLAALGDGDALGGRSALTFLADLGEPAAAPPTFLFRPLLDSSSPLTDMGELIGFCDSAAADVLTVRVGFFSPFIRLVCSLMKCSRQPQSNIRCRAARLVRQR